MGLEDELLEAANQDLLETTAVHGFISPATLASLLALQERLMIAMIMRLGGEAHFPDMAKVLAEDPGAVLEAEYSEEGVYTLRAVKG